jgi:hypothetical protein
VKRIEDFGSFLPGVAAGDAMNSVHIMILTGMCQYNKFHSAMIQHQVHHQILEFLKDNMEQNDCLPRISLLVNSLLDLKGEDPFIVDYSFLKGGGMKLLVDAIKIKC